MTDPASQALAILRRPVNRTRLLKLVDARLEAIEAARRAEEAQAARSEAESCYELEMAEKVNREAELARCRADPVHWFNTWVWTYDPRRIGKTDPATGARLSPFVQFKLWPRQADNVLWFRFLMESQQQGVEEKSRDTGATYMAGGFALHQWLFETGFKATFGSRDEALVDDRDNPDSIFEKIRIMLRRLPEWMMPEGFNWRVHDNKMRLVNPANGATITGEGGDEMGRGGRSTIYFVDEAAFVRRAEGVEAALSGNTDCVVWISSANGMGNLFYRKRMSFAASQVFRIHYSDDPRKTPEWVAAKKASMDPVNWASEYEIDYAASMEGVCIPAAWVQAAQRLRNIEPGLKPNGRGVAGVDIGGGKAKSVVVPKHGPLVSPPLSRAGADTTETAYWALQAARDNGCAAINFDAPGIGAGVASTLSKAEGFPGIKSNPVNTGVAPTKRVWPDGRTSAEMFGNLKAELWWLARTAFQKTYWHVMAMEGEAEYAAQPLDELIALPADPTLAAQLSTVRWFRNEGGKVVIETKQQLQKRSIPSPDFADALMLAYLEPEGDDIGDLSGMDPSAFHRPNPWAVG